MAAAVTEGILNAVFALSVGVFLVGGLIWLLCRAVLKITEDPADRLYERELKAAERLIIEQERVRQQAT